MTRGVYTCSVTNDYGQEYCSAEVKIELLNVIDETSYVATRDTKKNDDQVG